MKKAYSLNELMVTLAISVLLMAVSLPTLSTCYKDSQFQDFVSELTGHLLMARTHAKLTETSVALDFTPSDEYLYCCRVQDKTGWELLSFRASQGGYQAKIRNQLPKKPVLHPTTGTLLSRAMSSTHKPRVIFTPEGGSSATVVYSDQEGRAVCLVVSATTGRFKVFTRKPGGSKWRRFF